MKNSFLKTLLLCLFLAFMSILQAQILERQLISPYGNLSTTNDVHVSATGGELIITSVSTGAITVTQGFQQPNEEDLVGITELSDLSLEIRVYPNPSSSYVNIDIVSDTPVGVYLEMYDVLGNLVLKNKKLSVLSQISETVDFSRYPNGQYFFLFKDEENKLIQTIGVQKH